MFVGMLLKDQKLLRELRQNGFVVLPFLEKEELDSLNTFYNTIHQGQEPPLFIEDIHMTSWCSEPDYKQQVLNNLGSIFSGAVSRWFDKVRAVNNVFIVKRSGRETTFKVHQDWNVVDETQYESVNVWVPLHDVDESSGALWVLPRSHKINRPVRGAGYLFPDYTAHLKALEENAVSVKLKAGQAIVFYHSVIHGSPPNLSGKLRVAACFALVPESAPLCIYYQPSAGMELQQYAPPDDFMFHYTHLRSETTQRPPAERPVKVGPSYINKLVGREEIDALIGKKKNFFSRLLGK